MVLASQQQPSLRKFDTSKLMALSAPLLLACGGGDKVAPVIVPKLSAEESILQVSAHYATGSEARRLLAPPSPLAIHQRKTETRLSLEKGSCKELVRVSERFEYRDGKVVECTAVANRPLQAIYQFVQGEPAVKLVAHGSALSFRCSASQPAELETTLMASATELVLRDESLVVVAPATDRRRFLPEE